MVDSPKGALLPADAERAAPASPVLSAVLPAFNQAHNIAGNLREILARLDATGIDFEMIVVSDGSRDTTHAEAGTVDDPRVRVLRYERNMGKGYALRTGSAAARGEWVAWIDSDLDLDPTLIADFLERGRADRLDVVVGSKRHPESRVSYPAKRRLYSWLYQQLVRALFRLNVRDTQVGMKLFRREVLEEVLPVVLVKRFAFDLEMLAVANSFGFDRISEAPIALDYRFEASGVNWPAITHALWDTGAVFYRLRLLRYYARQRGLARRVARHRRANPPGLTIVLAPDEPVDDLSPTLARIRTVCPAGTQVLVAWPGDGDDSPSVAGARVIAVGDRPRAQRLAAAIDEVESEVVALAEHSCAPSDSWAAAALGLLADPDVGVVAGPVVSSLGGKEPRRDAAGILSESRIGVGGTRIRHHVGRLREVSDFPARNIFVRTEALRRALAEGYEADDQLCAVISGRQGLAVLCSPDVVTSRIPAPLWLPHLRAMHGAGVASGRRVAAGNVPRPRTLAPVALLAGALLTPRALLGGGALRRAWIAGASAYAAAIGAFAAVLVVLHRRPRLAALTAAGAVGSHLSFALGVVRGAVTGWADRAQVTRITRR